MASTSTWERIERRKLRQRERWTRPARPGDRPDPSLPAGTDMLPQIKHVVVLMMENHSFDNYLGDRKSTRLNSSHLARSRMPSSA